MGDDDPWATVKWELLYNFIKLNHYNVHLTVLYSKQWPQIYFTGPESLRGQNVALQSKACFIIYPIRRWASERVFRMTQRPHTPNKYPLWWICIIQL